MEDLSHWDSTTEFTADEAAALIAGVDPANPAAALYKAAPTLRLLKEGHRIARAFVTASPVTPDAFRLLRTHRSWAPALMSVLFDCYPMLHKEPWPGDPDRPFELPRRFAGPDGEFEVQRFARAEIHRWLEVEGLASKYAFLRSAELVGAASAAPVLDPMPAVDEEVKEDAARPQSIMPTPLPTRDMAICLSGLRNWNEEQWKATLGKQPKWLKECIHTRGQQGKSQTYWNPVLIGAALIRRDDIQSRFILARFQREELLKPWLETWRDYEAEWLTTD